MTNQALERARAGEEDAFRELTGPYRRELQVHIYRIVRVGPGRRGPAPRRPSSQRGAGLSAFEGRASFRAWLYRIATNRSLDALRATRRRPESVQPLTEMPGPKKRHGGSDLGRALPRCAARGDCRPSTGP